MTANCFHGWRVLQHRQTCSCIQTNTTQAIRECMMRVHAPREWPLTCAHQVAKLINGTACP